MPFKMIDGDKREMMIDSEVFGESEADLQSWSETRTDSDGSCLEVGRS